MGLVRKQCMQTVRLGGGFWLDVGKKFFVGGKESRNDKMQQSVSRLKIQL